MMHAEEIRQYCIAKPAVTESFPFDESTLVFKVMNKMFALLSLEKFEQGSGSINLKCDPAWAEELRGEHPDDILPGYHMNKKHWNTVEVNGGLAPKFIIELIDHSYELIVKSLPKKMKQQLENGDY
tara:strand:- start:5232 stop:5609 length:378 start_codon:yes stop_codon:yes gene_type:complete